MAFATPEDVAVRWARTPSDDELTLIQVRLDDVERIIRKRIPYFEELVLSGDLDVADVVQVEAEAVLRVIRNPEGFVSETDGNYTYQMAHTTTAGQLSLTDDEWKMLGVSVGGKMFQLVPTLAPGE